MKVSVSVISLIFAAAFPLIGALPAAQFEQPASNKIDRRFLHDIFVGGAAAATADAHIHRRSHLDVLGASAAAAAAAAASVKAERRGLLNLAPLNAGAGGAATATATVAINTQEGCGCKPSPSTSSTPTPTHTTTHTTTTTSHPTSTPGAPGAPGAPGTPGTPGGSSHPAPTTTVTVTASGTRKFLLRVISNIRSSANSFGSSPYWQHLLNWPRPVLQFGSKLRLLERCWPPWFTRCCPARCQCSDRHYLQSD